jgi:hypothetical protein
MKRNGVYGVPNRKKGNKRKEQNKSYSSPSDLKEIKTMLEFEYMTQETRMKVDCKGPRLAKRVQYETQKQELVCKNMMEINQLESKVAELQRKIRQRKKDNGYIDIKKSDDIINAHKLKFKLIENVKQKIITDYYSNYINNLNI